MFSPNCVIGLVAPDIAIKSAPVRSYLYGILRSKIIISLNKNKVEYSSIESTPGRFFIFSEKPKEVAQALEKCFGLNELYLAKKVKTSSIEEIYSAITADSKKYLKKSFAVRGRSFRADLSSQNIGVVLGGYILKENQSLKVNLTKPESEVFCLIFGDKAYYYFEKIPGAGGMPVSSQGTVAIYGNNKNAVKLGWLLLKQGAKIAIVLQKSASEKEQSAIGKELIEWNSFEQIKTLPLSEAKQRLSEGRYLAVFTDAKSSKEAEKHSKLFGFKVFAPFLAGSSKTPFD